MKRLQAILALLMLGCVLLTGCGYNDFGVDYPDEDDPPAANISIGELHRSYSGEAITFNRDLVVAGYVTTSDKAENFYRTFFIDDGTGAVEILAGLYDLHSVYALHQQVIVSLNGLVLHRTDGGTYQIGLPAASGSSPVTYFGHRVMLNKYVFRKDIYEAAEPMAITSDGINESLVGKLVKVAGMTADSEYSSETVWSGTLKFRVGAQDSVYVNTSNYAAFAGEKIPLETISITGILQRGRVSGEYVYQLKMRDINDVEE